MTGFDDFAKKAKDFISSGQAKKALNSEKAEGVSDSVLDSVAGFANRVTGGKYADKIDGVRDTVDGKIGAGDDAEGGAATSDTTTGTRPTPPTTRPDIDPTP